MKIIVTVIIIIVTLIGLLRLLEASDEYIPRESYRIKTVDNEILTLSCPEIDPLRSILTYTIEEEGNEMP